MQKWCRVQIAHRQFYRKAGKRCKAVTTQVLARDLLPSREKDSRNELGEKNREGRSPMS